MRRGYWHNEGERKPLNRVMIPVETNANHEPKGWKGALYGSVSREMPCAFNALINRLQEVKSEMIPLGRVEQYAHMRVANTHPGYGSKATRGNVT